MLCNQVKIIFFLIPGILVYIQNIYIKNRGKYEYELIVVIFTNITN